MAMSKSARILALAGTCFVVQAQPVGMFESSADVGANPLPGSAEIQSGSVYRITGGGANIWGTADAFRFAWKKISGDVTLSADVRFEGTGTDPHRKAVLMIRQSLDPDSAYADVAV